MHISAEEMYRRHSRKEDEPVRKLGPRIYLEESETMVPIAPTEEFPGTRRLEILEHAAVDQVRAIRNLVEMADKIADVCEQLSSGFGEETEESEKLKEAKVALRSAVQDLKSRIDLREVREPFTFETDGGEYCWIMDGNDNYIFEGVTNDSDGKRIPRHELDMVGQRIVDLLNKYGVEDG